MTTTHTNGNTSEFGLAIKGSCSLTISISPSGSGRVDLNPPPIGGTYGCGTPVTMTAIPADSCWQFSHWSVDATGTTNPYIITVDGKKNVTVNFVKKTYTLTTNVSPPGSGSVSLNPLGTGWIHGSLEFGTECWMLVSDFGQVLNIVGAVADSIPKQEGLYLSVRGRFRPDLVSICMQGEIFEVLEFSIDQTGGTYECGTQVILTATPSTGYHFVSWSGDASGTTNPITITMDASNKVLLLAAPKMSS